MANIVVRDARTEDAKTLSELIENHFDKNNTRPDLEELEDWLNGANDCTLIATLNSEIAGFMHARIVSKITALAETLFVKENYRNLGVATLLDEEMIRRVRAKGVKYYAHMADYSSEESRAFMKKHGYESEVVLEWWGKYI